MAAVDFDVDDFITNALHLPSPQQAAPINDLEIIFERAHDRPTPFNVRHFLRRASELSLALPELERYLNILEQAKIVPTAEKNRTLFCQAAALGETELAQGYAQKYVIDAKKLLIDLLSSEHATVQTVQLLTRNEMDFSESEISLPRLYQLLELGADVSKIRINGCPLFIWAIKIANGLLIKEVLKRNPPLYPELFSDGDCLAYFAAQLQVPPSQMTAQKVLQALQKLGLNIHSAPCFTFFFTHSQAEMRAVLTHFDPKELPFSSILPAVRLFVNRSMPSESSQFLESYAVKQPIESFYTADGVDLLIALLSLEKPDIAKQLLRRGFDIQRASRDGVVLLQRLLNESNAVAISILLAEKKVEPSTPLSNGISLLFWLASKPYTYRLFTYLIAKGIEVDVRGREQETLIHAAVKAQNLFCLNELLQARKIDVNAQDQHGKPALYYALTPGVPLEFARALLVAGALPFHLGENIRHYTSYIHAQNYHLILGKSQIWKLYVPQKSFTDFISTIVKARPDLRADALECALLVPGLSDGIICSFASPAECLSSLQACRKKYPQAPVDAFYPLLVTINPAHLKHNALQHSAQEEITLEDLLIRELHDFRKAIIKKMCDDKPKYKRFSNIISITSAGQLNSGQQNSNLQNPELHEAVSDFTCIYTAAEIVASTTSFLQRELSKQNGELIRWLQAKKFVTPNSEVSVSAQASYRFLLENKVLQERRAGILAKFMQQKV